MILGQRLKVVRILRGYSQEQVGQSIGICQVGYSKIELGKVRINDKRLLKIVAFLKVDIEKLYQIPDL